jgi:hypothetical protein
VINGIPNQKLVFEKKNIINNFKWLVAKNVENRIRSLYIKPAKIESTLRQLMGTIGREIFGISDEKGGLSQQDSHMPKMPTYIPKKTPKSPERLA